MWQSLALPITSFPLLSLFFKLLKQRLGLFKCEYVLFYCLEFEEALCVDVFLKLSALFLAYFK